MKKFKYIIALISIAFFSSCSEDTVGVTAFGSLSGTVTAAETGEPLEGVKITTNPSSTTVFTNADGNFTLASIEVDDYAVQAELDGFATAFEPITIFDGQNTVVAIDLDVSQQTNLTPLQPVLITPEDGAVDVPIAIDFLWTSSKNDIDTIKYTLSLRNGTTSELQEFEIEQDTTFSITNLQISTNYFWQVTATDEVNDPVTSSLSSFTTVSVPDNPFLFVREINGNSVIFSGGEDVTPGNAQPDFNVVQLTDENKNSFRPRKNVQVNKIAFLRTAGSQTHIFTMDLDGTNVTQVTNNIGVAGFRLSELDFTWALNGSELYYPNFNKIYAIDPDSGGTTDIYTAPPGSIVSEIAAPELEADILLIKTNDLNGYNVRIFTYRISTGMEEDVILENEMGAAGSIDITANGDRVLFSRDISGFENLNYRLFESRLFLYDLINNTFIDLDTNVTLGDNDFDAQFSPSEGQVIWTRKGSNLNAIPNIFIRPFENAIDDELLFTESMMPDWE